MNGGLYNTRQQLRQTKDSNTTDIQWQQPRSGWRKCNVDASFHDESSHTGWGWCLCNLHGAFIVAGTNVSMHKFSTLEGEAMALLEAIHEASFRGWSNIVFESDSKIVVDALQTNHIGRFSFSTTFSTLESKSKLHDVDPGRWWCDERRWSSALPLHQLFPACLCNPDSDMVFGVDAVVFGSGVSLYLVDLYRVGIDCFEAVCKPRLICLLVSGDISMVRVDIFSGSLYDEECLSKYGIRNDVTGAELWESLARFWKIGEVCIPAKNDKFGRRFAFARFIDVSDTQTLLKKIEGLWFGSYKLRANLSRFTKEEDDSGVAGKQNGRVQQLNGDVNRGVPEVKEGFLKNMSFKEALGVGDNKGKERRNSNNIGTSRGPKHQNHRSRKDKANLAGALEIEVVPENVENLKNCYVGTLWNAKLAVDTQMLISMEGYQHLKATMLGMDKILLSSNIEEGVKKAYEEDKQWWESKFSDLKPWSPLQKPNERLIWLIQHDNQTVNQDRLDVVRALISVSSWDFVDEVLDINVCNEIFMIRIIEERFGDINLGFKREMDSQIYSDGSSSHNPLSDREPNSVNEVCDGLENNADWNEGWPEDNSGEPKQIGYYLQDNTSMVSDTPEKGVGERTLAVQVKGMNETEVGLGEDESCNLGEKTGKKKEFVSLLALTWVEGGDVAVSAQTCGEKLEVACSHVEVERETRVLIDNGPLEPNHELGHGLPINKTNNKGKCIMMEGDDLAMDKRSLFKGSCSTKHFGPGGLGVVMEEEY
ncbi:hypothetical protein TSUD_410170 [Trifolium subterraneum]|uniref:RNase H type-1 domain-containing protein n=1 Tax=Trifolium subterraneum TaxID=3900 RepID=A0A2Z6PU95_TRISU|nr:hypothetical protein TSUD_410170 [Trifolium subterraneum]